MRPDPSHLIEPTAPLHRRLASALFVILTMGILFVVSPGVQAGQDDGVALPGLEAVDGLGALVGEWSMSGLTGNGAERDSEGRLFRARQSIEWIEPGRSLGVVWSVMLEDGTVITSGRGRINWDDIAGAVVNTYRGEENGRPFTGSATLVAAADGVFDWRGHETSGTSESVNFEVTYAFPSQDLCTVDFIPTCVDGDVTLDPARFSWKRVNPFHEAMPFVPDLVGDWVLRSGGSELVPDGSRMIIRPGQGGRSLSFLTFEPGSDGDFIASEILWMDESTGDLGIRSIANDGRMNQGSASVDRRDGRLGLQVEWFGDGASGDGRDESSDRMEQLSLVGWLTVDEDRMDLDLVMVETETGYILEETRAIMIWARAGN